MSARSIRWREFGESGLGDTFFPMKDWNTWSKVLFMKPHKNNRDRFNLAFFFIANGLQPDIVWKAVLGVDIVDGQILIGDYDRTAHHQVRTQIPQQVRDNKLFFGRKKVYDVVLKKDIYACFDFDSLLLGLLMAQRLLWPRRRSPLQLRSHRHRRSCWHSPTGTDLGR